MTETPTPPPPVAVRERGYMHDPSSFSGWGWDDLTHETTPELMWPQSVEQFHRMDTSDAQCSSVMRAVVGPLARTQWWINGKGCDDEVVEHVARNLALPIRGTGTDDVPADNVPLRGADRFSWDAHVPEALLMLKYGHSFGEQLYWFDDRGRAHIRKVALRPARTIQRVIVARDGGLEGIVQRAAGGGFGASAWRVESRPIPVSRLVAYVNEREGANWLGKSLFRSSWINWVLKCRDMKTMSMSNLRNGIGLPVYTGAEKEEDLSKGRAIAGSVRAGDDSGAALPYGATLKLQGVDGRLPDILASIKYHDEQIARGVLAHLLNLGSQTGSWALGKTFANVFDLSLDYVGQGLGRTGHRHIVTDLVAANWGPDEPVPALEFDPIGAQESELDTWRRMTGLTDDAAMLAWIRSNVGDTSNPTQEES